MYKYIHTYIHTVTFSILFKLMGEYDTTPIVSMNATLFYVYLLTTKITCQQFPRTNLKRQNTVQLASKQVNNKTAVLQ